MNNQTNNLLDHAEKRKKILWAVTLSLNGTACKRPVCDRKIRSSYGASVEVLTLLWQIVQEADCNIRLMHFLWGMQFLKNYKSDDVSAAEVGCTPKTYRKWVWRVVAALAGQHKDVVSYFSYF